MNEIIQKKGLSNFTKGQIAGMVSLLPSLAFMAYLAFSKNSIPTESEVQKGYAIPSNLEIKLEDLDSNGEKEVIMRHDGRNYLLKLDENGKPTIQDYELIPARIVPK